MEIPTCEQCKYAESNHLPCSNCYEYNLFISKEERNQTCFWKHNRIDGGHINWITECGFDEPVIAEDWKFCPYCGKVLELEDDY
jgi:hypothetical protein